METLPSSIESYLQEAGFSGTEILILRNLLEEDALTLRQLAAKTGKSTGVLDQAVKKLLRKKILSKEVINDAPKYTLHSLKSVVDWMEKDMHEKRELLERKHQNFETFVSTLEVGKKRPEMEHYEGLDGIKKAYAKLLQERKEMLHFFPVSYKEEEDPLRDFRVEFFRERKRRELFSRYMVNDTPLGRRFQSRDPYEYRRTALVSTSDFPFSFEKIVAGDVIVCINHEKQQASFVRYPDLVQTERQLFEKLWRDALEDEQSDEAPAAVSEIPLKTRTLSNLREFFLSKKSLATFAICGLLAAGMTYGLYRHNVELNTKRVQEKVLSIAATGVLQFEAADIEAVRTPEDIAKPEYKKLIYQLNEIRRLNPGVKYIYIMRPTEDLGIWKFVADADSLDPTLHSDFNLDGKVDEADELISPGDLYEIDIAPQMTEVLQGLPTVDESPVADQWGTFISGYGPIKDGDANIVAILGVDVEAAEVQQLTRNTFEPLLYFLGLFVLFTLIRFAAFNRSLAKEAWEVLQMKQFLFTSAICALIACGITYALYLQTRSLNLEKMKTQVKAIAATGADYFDPRDIEALREEQDWLKPEWDKVVTQLEEIRHSNEDLLFTYLLRFADDSDNTVVFIADSHSRNPYINVDKSQENDIDLNGDEIIDEADELQWPGQVYSDAPEEVVEALRLSIPLTNKNFYQDQWGNLLSGYAPIKKDGKTIAIFAVDIRATQLDQLNTSTFAPIITFTLFFLLLLSIRIQINRNLRVVITYRQSR